MNHQKADTMMTCKHTYEIAGNPAENKLILEELGIMNNQRFQEKCIVALTNLEKQQVEKSIGKGKVNKFITFPTVDYGFAQNTHWTPLDYGPVKVPEKGQKVNITSENYLRYSRLILIESDGEKDAKSLIGQTYVFADNYYFLMGDNRENALDSRYIGFISEKEIVGKALYIFWSEDKSRIGTSF